MGYCHENYEFSIHHYRPALVVTSTCCNNTATQGLTRHFHFESIRFIQVVTKPSNSHANTSPHLYPHFKLRQHQLPEIRLAESVGGEAPKNESTTTDSRDVDVEASGPEDTRVSESVDSTTSSSSSSPTSSTPNPVASESSRKNLVGDDGNSWASSSSFSPFGREIGMALPDDSK